MISLGIEGDNSSTTSACVETILKGQNAAFIGDSFHESSKFQTGMLVPIALCGGQLDPERVSVLSSVLQPHSLSILCYTL